MLTKAKLLLIFAIDCYDGKWREKNNQLGILYHITFNPVFLIEICGFGMRVQVWLYINPKLL